MARVQVRGGGVPSAVELAALTASLSAMLDDEARAGVDADPRPAAYRSRWRRAALIEASEVPGHLKHDGPAWGG